MNIFLCDSLHIAKLLSQRAMPTLNCFSTLLRMTDFHGLSGLLTWVTVAWTHQLAHVARAAEERARTKRCSRAQGVPSLWLWWWALHFQSSSPGSGDPRDSPDPRMNQVLSDLEAIPHPTHGALLARAYSQLHGSKPEKSLLYIWAWSAITPFRI